MFSSLVIVIIAFIWLMYETKFLTIRLPYGISVVQMIFGMIFITIGFILYPIVEEEIERLFKTQKVLTNNNHREKDR